MHSACQEIIRMLTAKIPNLERQEAARGRRVREEQVPYGEGDGFPGQAGSGF